MGNWASIWTSGNRGAQAPKPDPITEPETTQPNIATQQTSRRQGKPRAELLHMSTTITAYNDRQLHLERPLPMLHP